MQKLTSYAQRHWLASAVLVTAAFVIGGVAYAAIPDSSGTIHGCYSSNGAKSTGGSQLNIIDAAAVVCEVGTVVPGGNVRAGVRRDGQHPLRPTCATFVIRGEYE